MPKNRVCLIDFGAVGYFGPTLRMRMERITAAFAHNDVEGAVDATLDSWEPLPLRDIDGFKSELKPIYQRMVSNAASKHGDPNFKSNGRMLVESARLASKYGISPPWELLRFTRLMWEYDTIVVALAPNFNFSRAYRSYFYDRMRRRLRAHIERKNLARFGAEMIDILAGLPRDLSELRYQAYHTFRRSDHLYRHSMSKLSYFGKVALEYTMAAMAGCIGGLVYYRATTGAEAIDAWLAERLPVPAPWWLYVAVLAHMLARLQRLRTRVSDVD